MADKQILGTYVHDAVAIEIRKHTFNTMLAATKQHLITKLIDISNKAKKERKTYQKTINELNAEKDKLEHPDENTATSNCQRQIDLLNWRITNNKPKSFWHYFLLGLSIAGGLYIPLVFLMIIPVGLINPAINNEKGALLCFIYAAIVSLLISIVFTIIKTIIEKHYFIISKSSNRKKLNELEKQLEGYKDAEAKEALKRKNRLDEIHNEIEQISNQISELNMRENNEQSALQQIVNKQISLIEGNIETVSTQINEFYSMNLIPPDYRSLECVIAFNQMFRNDLVDNMREAALLYEERVFRGEMIKGLDNIYKAINTLGGMMSETISVLRNIESNTNRMCDELIDISSNLVRMNVNVTGHLSTISSNLSSGLDSIADSQRDIASELEYSRYANEAIRTNSDRIIWYTEQHRQGLL